MRKVPWSDPPERPTSWWRSIPGQVAILVILGGLAVIGLALCGVDVGQPPR